MGARFPSNEMSIDSCYIPLIAVYVTGLTVRQFSALRREVVTQLYGRCGHQRDWRVEPICISCYNRELEAKKDATPKASRRWPTHRYTCDM